VHAKFQNESKIAKTRSEIHDWPNVPLLYKFLLYTVKLGNEHIVPALKDYTNPSKTTVNRTGDCCTVATLSSVSSKSHEPDGQTDDTVHHLSVIFVALPVM